MLSGVRITIPPLPPSHAGRTYRVVFGLQLKRHSGLAGGRNPINNLVTSGMFTFVFA
jgi:hypothetical protein